MFTVLNKYNRILDPRTALVILFVAGTLFVFNVSLYAECAYFFLLLFLLFINHNFKLFSIFLFLFMAFIFFEGFLKEYPIINPAGN